MLGLGLVLGKASVMFGALFRARVRVRVGNRMRVRVRAWIRSREG